MNRDFYDEAYNQAVPFEGTDKRTAAAIVPHHLMVKEYIAGFFKQLESEKYTTVVLIGPNHFNRGGGNILISPSDWDTPYGVLENDQQAVKKLFERGYAADEYAFANEHSISGLTAFIKKSLPTVQFIPIIVKEDATAEELEALVALLQEVTDPERTLLLASVDFSHYMPLTVAELHDETSISALQTFNYERVKKLEVDSTASLRAVLKWAESRDALKATVLAHTNSSHLIDKPDEPSTSHVIMAFSDGEQTRTSNVTVQFFGDIMLDRNVATLIDQNGIGHILDDLAGEEGRFFRGVDIFSANLEGPVTRNGEHYPPVASIDFAFDPKNVEALKKYGFNYFTIANNHAADQGAQGVKENREILTELNYQFSGCVDAAVGDCSSTIIEVAGKKIGMVGLSQVYHELDQEKVIKIINNLKKQTDAVVVNIHWGVEYEHQFGKVQQNLAHAMVDAGAGLIIGHHPHVVQGMEVYNNVPIFYSLGNSIFDQYFSADTQEGLSVGTVLNFENNEITGVQLYFYPYKMNSGKVMLRRDAEKNIFLQKFVGWSSIDQATEKSIVDQSVMFVSR